MEDLSPERRQQIEEEERQRHAEEQYRREVRAGLSASIQARAAKPKKSRTPWIILALALIASGFALSTMRNGTQLGRSSVFALNNRYVPVSQKIASGQVQIQAGGYVQYRIAITPDMRNPQITGNFTASGGGGNDIEAVVAEETEYMNWINGHPAKVRYTSDGRKTMDRFDIRLSPGTYYFALSNKFSVLSGKSVFVDVALSYSRVETN